MLEFYDSKYIVLCLYHNTVRDSSGRIFFKYFYIPSLHHFLTDYDRNLRSKKNLK